MLFGAGIVSKYLKDKNASSTYAADLAALQAQYKAQNYANLLAQIKARGMTVKEALLEWDLRKKAKATAKRENIKTLVQAKADRSQAQLVQANADAAPQDNKPLVIGGIFIVLIIFIYMKFKKK